METTTILLHLYKNLIILDAVHGHTLTLFHHPRFFLSQKLYFREISFRGYVESVFSSSEPQLYYYPFFESEPCARPITTDITSH